MHERKYACAKKNANTYKCTKKDAKAQRQIRARAGIMAVWGTTNGERMMITIDGNSQTYVQIGSKTNKLLNT